MHPKVIQVDFHQKRTVLPPHASSVWTREERRAWQRVGLPTPLWRRVAILLFAAALHATALFGARLLKPPAIIDTDSKTGGQGGAARVTFFEGTKSQSREDGLPEEQIYPNKPVDAPVITGPSTSAARPAQPASSPDLPAVRREQPRDFGAADRTARVKVKQEVKREEREPEPAVSPEKEPDATRTTAETQSDTTEPSADGAIGFSRNLQNLLPNSMSEYVAAQRRVGSVYGKGAVGGDVAPEAEAPVGFKAPDRQKVVVKRYDYAAYFLSLDRRFSDAWGGERFLPRGSTFVGNTGEFIEYDIVINRDGTLVKIINVSKQAQPDRDFSSVDALVHEVFSHVFPMEPVPARIRDTPLILRKRIQFTGYKYFMF